MDIHPYTNHDIARLRCEERLLRAETAQRAREVPRRQLADRGARRIEVAPLRLLQRIRRRVAKTLPHAGPNAV